MKNRSNHPRIYEINTWVWIEELSKSAGTVVTLANVPKEAWNAIAELSMDAVWFMGVWERSPIGIGIAMENAVLQEEFKRVLPGYTPADMIGSAYCIRRYEVDERLGGAGGLATARKELAKRGMSLILDYVPNHVAPDHPWVREYPEYFIRGDSGDLENEPESFMDVDGKVFACGRDPYFPAWQDVLQLNAFSKGLRNESIKTALSIAEQCDGMRCDMAMLLLSDVYARTWGEKAGVKPKAEYWLEVISAVKKKHPDTVFIAETYWDLEWELLQLGFDYCYDKRLYDRLVFDTAEGVRLHLLAEPAYQARLIRFIENHDEPRAAWVFSKEKARSAAVVFATLSGAKLFHEGQFEGRKAKLPVFLKRRPDEGVDYDLKAFYGRLMEVMNLQTIRQGRWGLCTLSGWPENTSWMNMASWCWQKDQEICLIVVNLSGMRSQARVHLTGVNLAGMTVKMTDIMNNEVYERSGNEMADIGLYVDLEPWAYHVLVF